MGCGCKDNNVNEIIEKGPITFKSVLNKIGSGILILLFVVLLTPIIVIMIWYFTVKIILGSDENVINLLVDKFTNKGKKEEYEEKINTDEYELMDVDVIK